MMSDRNNIRGYVFGAALASAGLGGVNRLVQSARADTTNAVFSFENVNNSFFPSGTATIKSTTGTTTSQTITVSTVTYASYAATAGQSVGPFIADSGVGSAFGYHAGASTYSTPTGSGSAHSLAVNNFAVGDYYEFDVPTTATQSLIISFDQVSSSSGPRDFNLIAIDESNGTGGSTYTIGSYAIPSSPSSFFASSATAANLHFAFTDTDAALLSNSSVAFRIVVADVSTGYASSAVGTSGTDRVDNFTIDSVPEPTSAPMLLLAASASVGGLLRRRRRAGTI